MEFLNEWIKSYIADGHYKIQGWIDERYVALMEMLDAFQKQAGIKGGGGEIGVHHGRSFIPMSLLKNEYYNLAIDVFEDQLLNTDQSGAGNLEIFQHNINKYAPGSKVVILKSDSSFLPHGFIDEFISKYGQLSYFSVDGSHTVEATITDILTASRLLVNGGLIALDDYYNQDWPGVHEGVIKYLLFHDVKFFPLCYGFNKLVLCARGWHARYLNNMQQTITQRSGFVYKKVKICGYELLSIK